MSEIYNCVVFELATNHAREALLYLQNIGKINILKWLGNNDDGSGVILAYYGKILTKDELEKESMICPPEVYNIVYKKLYIFLDMISRVSCLPIYEKVNMFNLYVNYYYGLFTRKSINLIFFGDVPHFGVDSVAYDVAQAMGIKSVLFLQSNMSNRFWCTTNINDIGVFNIIKNTEKVEVEVADEYEKNLFYMKDLSVIEPDNNCNDNGLLKKFENLWYIVKYNKGTLYTKIKEKIMRRQLNYCERSLKRLEYSIAATKNVQSEVDFSKKYVYFALHLQPEQSTSAMGKEYCDQLLAIERVAKFIPDDWKIYVKENPKQSYYMRLNYFFMRLALIDKAVYVGREVSTYDLIAHSQFVATITGTVGWEAISGGKCALVFGLAWYRKLPGVFEYNSNLQLEDILAYKINHKKVEEEYNNLMTKSFEGIIQMGYEEMVPGYSDLKNVEYLKKSLAKIITIAKAQE